MRAQHDPGPADEEHHRDGDDLDDKPGGGVQARAARQIDQRSPRRPPPPSCGRSESRAQKPLGRGRSTRNLKACSSAPEPRKIAGPEPPVASRRAGERGDHEARGQQDAPGAGEVDPPGERAQRGVVLDQELAAHLRSPGRMPTARRRGPGPGMRRGRRGRRCASPRHVAARAAVSVSRDRVGIAHLGRRSARGTGGIGAPSLYSKLAT